MERSLGKEAGTIFKRKNQNNIWTARVEEKDENGKSISTKTKTFNITKYGSKKQAKKEAIRWKIITSYKLNVTKNMIKIINNE